MIDQIYMSRALKIAQRGYFTTTPNPNVGCVIVKNNIIIGEGWHKCKGMPHAEIYALRNAGSEAYGSTVYVTLEPCNYYGFTPPCCDALINAGVNRVVIAVEDPNPKVTGLGIAKLKKAGINISIGLMSNESENLNKGFFKRMRTGYPWLNLKLGMSLDGRIAIKNGQSKWITSSNSRRDVQSYRAKSSAILSSSNTILIDNPSLTVRWSELNYNNSLILDKNLLRQPIRIIIDTKNQITPQHRIILQPGKIWLMRKIKDNRKWPDNVTQIIGPMKGDYIDLSKMLLLLGKYQINDILVEAGSTLAGCLIKDNLLDELTIYLSPKILGHESLAVFKLFHLNNIANAPEYLFQDMQKIGDDIRLTLKPKSKIDYL
ncbi:MAG: bifunctional diaminohydroxyphosphoribosylaminopyrimidine deaminase/5-amino-6-(5-phosphoribosylamino)uracil reductase RibD [Pantoea sp. Brub]|nr:bifunctional diaminohydroxyphosphoribosylaminopyrimidine deaminase/5-amino-6-(5-phosphoribosylamino)uracil reductase RibD [Pantoea sp. Brub]